MGSAGHWCCRDPSTSQVCRAKHLPVSFCVFSRGLGLGLKPPRSTKAVNSLSSALWLIHNSWIWEALSRLAATRRERCGVFPSSVKQKTVKKYLYFKLNITETENTVKGHCWLILRSSFKFCFVNSQQIMYKIRENRSCLQVVNERPVKSHRSWPENGWAERVSLHTKEVHRE